MNKLIIALFVACASACVFGAQKISTNDWFSASAETGASVVSDGSSWSTTPTVSGNKYVIESEIDSPVTFSSATTTAGDFTEVSFKLDTTIVPADALTEANLAKMSPSAKVAFAASEDSDGRAYYAWLGESWQKLSGAVPSAEDGTPYVLVVTFDQKANTVQFKVDGIPLTLNGSAVIDYNAGVSTQVSIDFVGSGNIAYLKGNQQTVEAEIIVVDGGTIEIKEEDVAKFDIPSGTSKDTFFTGKASAAFTGFKSDISVGAAYALGLIAEDETTHKMTPVNDGELIVKAIAESTDAGIKIGLNVTPRSDTGATITFNIVDTTASENVATGLTGDQIVIPTTKLGKGLKTFKVQAVVTPAAK